MHNHTSLSAADLAALADTPDLEILDAEQDGTLQPGEHSAAWADDTTWMVTRGAPGDATDEDDLPSLPAGFAWVCVG